jgi:hypothetical protein
MRLLNRAGGFITSARRVLGMVVVILAAGHPGTARDLATTSRLNAGGVSDPSVRMRPSVLPIAVLAPRDIRDSVVAYMCAEADAVWSPAGVRFEWHRVPPAEVVSTSWLAVQIDERPSSDLDGGRTVLGWIPFTATGPRRSIYVSRSNVEELLRRTSNLDDITVFTHEILLGRALGRALAHELGHYLLRSRLHTPHGMMRATRSAEDFFRSSRAGFELSLGEQQVAAMHLMQETATKGPESRGV